MAKVVKHIHKRIPSQLDWEKLAHQREIRSPEHAYRHARVGTHAKVQAERFYGKSAYKQRAEDRADMQMRNEERQRVLAEKAQFDAEIFEKQYTQKQKQSIAKGRRLIEAADQNPDWDEKEKGMWREAVFSKYILGVMPTEQPKTDNWGPGQGVGKIWDQDGVMMSGKANGETWQVDWRKTAKGQAAEQELTATRDAAKLQASMAKEKRDAIRELMKSGVFSKADPVTGKAIMRSVGADEARQIVGQLYGEDQQQQAPVDKAGEAKALSKAEAFIEAVRSRYNDIEEIPEQLRQQFFDAVDLLQEVAVSPETTGTGDRITIVKTDADYKKLSPGTEFIDPDGKRRRKPKGR